MDHAKSYPRNGPREKLPLKWTTRKVKMKKTVKRYNSVSFHAIWLKFFLVGPLKIWLVVLAFSEPFATLLLAKFAMLVSFALPKWTQRRLNA